MEVTAVILQKRQSLLAVLAQFLNKAVIPAAAQKLLEW